MTKYDIQIINLDRNIARWSNIERQFVSQKIENYVRFSAFDGKTIETSQQINLVDPSAIASARRGYRFSHEEHNFGSIGCYLSHVGTWEHIVNSGNNFGIVFEDDIKLPDSFLLKFEKMIQDAPRDWDLIVFGPYELIEPVRQRKRKKNAMHEFVTARWFMLNSYVIKTSCCKKFLRKAFPVKIQIDWWVASWSKSNIWILGKPITTFSQGYRSDINHTPVILGISNEQDKMVLKGASQTQQNTLIIIIILLVTIIVVTVVTATTITLTSKRKKMINNNV